MQAQVYPGNCIYPGAGHQLWGPERFWASDRYSCHSKANTDADQRTAKLSQCLNSKLRQVCAFLHDLGVKFGVCSGAAHVGACASCMLLGRHCAASGAAHTEHCFTSSKPACSCRTANARAHTCCP